MHTQCAHAVTGPGWRMALEPFFTQPVSRRAVPGESRSMPAPHTSQRYGLFSHDTI